MSIWKKTKDAGNKAYKKTGQVANTVSGGMVNGGRAAVNGTKKVAGKLKFW
jgi:hypothetical protein